MCKKLHIRRVVILPHARALVRLPKRATQRQMRYRITAAAEKRCAAERCLTCHALGGKQARHRFDGASARANRAASRRKMDRFAGFGAARQCAPNGIKRGQRAAGRRLLHRCCACMVQQGQHNDNKDNHYQE